LNKRLDRLLQLSERHAGVAKQRQLNGKANAIGIPAAGRHQILIGPGQGEATRHAVWINRDAEECVALIVGQQLSIRHLCSPGDGGDLIECLSVKRTLADSQPFRQVYEIYLNV